MLFDMIDTLPFKSSSGLKTGNDISAGGEFPAAFLAVTEMLTGE